MEFTKEVSIHAPRVGRDLVFMPRRWPRRCFNSRAPRGARLVSPPDLLSPSVFQFTRPAWGATARALCERMREPFQFTRPAWGATPKAADF